MNCKIDGDAEDKSVSNSLDDVRRRRESGAVLKLLAQCRSNSEKGSPISLQDPCDSGKSGGFGSH